MSSFSIFYNNNSPIKEGRTYQTHNLTKTIINLDVAVVSGLDLPSKFFKHNSIGESDG